MGGTTQYQMPAPVDYSNAMMAMSNNQLSGQLANTGAMIIGLTQASADRQMQISAQRDIAMETLDTKVQIAKLNYLQSMSAEENRHVERMGEIEVRATELDVLRTRGNETDTSNFMS